MHFRAIRSIGFLALLMLQGVSSHATLFVTYEGDVDPTLNAPAFTFTQSNQPDPPIRTAADGILTLGNTNVAGGNQFSRQDAASLDDLFVAEFRVRPLIAGQGDAFPKSSALTQFGFGSTTENTLNVLVFVGDGVVKLRLAGEGTYVDRDAVVDTSVFHTYTLLKDEDANVSLYIDGSLALEQAAVKAGAPHGGFPFQLFAANPQSKAEWDFFRYAIGPDAQDYIPVPEPSAFALLFGTGLVTCVRRKKRI